MYEPLLINDPKVMAVPIEECGEPMVQLNRYPLLATTGHPRATSPADTKLHCRERVAERLLAAEKALPRGTRLLIVECHRPLWLQADYWKSDLRTLRKRYPNWSEERLAEENAKFIAPPWDAPPHSTGGAVDLTLVDAATGEELDMGTPLNTEGSVSYTAAAGLPERAKTNRHALLSAMRSVGFVNYGFEWWHYSYGDRYWAYLTAQPAARYGSV